MILTKRLYKETGLKYLLFLCVVSQFFYLSCLYSPKPNTITNRKSKKLKLLVYMY